MLKITVRQTQTDPQHLFIKHSFFFLMAAYKIWRYCLDLFIRNHKFINPMNKNVWHHCCVPATVLGTGNHGWIKHVCPRGAYILVDRNRNWVLIMGNQEASSDWIIRNYLTLDVNFKKESAMQKSGGEFQGEGAVSAKCTGELYGFQWSIGRDWTEW